MDLWILLKRDPSPIVFNAALIAQIVGVDHGYVVNTVTLGRDYHISPEEFDAIVHRLATGSEGDTLLDLTNTPHRTGI
jgi:hypothetical protein